MAVYAFTGSVKYHKKRLTEESSKKRNDMKKILNEMRGKHIEVDLENETYTFEADDEDMEKNDDGISIV